MDELSIFWGFYSWGCVGPGITHLGYLLLGRFEYLERTDQIFINAHECAWVVELPTIVWGWEYGNKHPFWEKLVALFHHLMCPADQIEIMLLTKHLHVIRTEGERDSSFIFTPTLGVFVWVRPQEIAKKTWIIKGLPVSGTSVGFSIFFICSIDSNSGDKPPCMHKMRSSIKAATGRQLKQSIKSFQSFMLYRLLP